MFHLLRTNVHYLKKSYGNILLFYILYYNRLWRLVDVLVNPYRAFVMIYLRRYVECSQLIRFLKLFQYGELIAHYRYCKTLNDYISHSKTNFFNRFFWCMSITETLMILCRQIESKDISSSSYLWINYSAQVGWKCLIGHGVSENQLVLVL